MRYAAMLILTVDMKFMSALFVGSSSRFQGLKSFAACGRSEGVACANILASGLRSVCRSKVLKVLTNSIVVEFTNPDRV